jgi:hypothetical protein
MELRNFVAAIMRGVAHSSSVSRHRARAKLLPTAARCARSARTSPTFSVTSPAPSKWFVASARGSLAGVLAVEARGCSICRPASRRERCYGSTCATDAPFGGRPHAAAHRLSLFSRSQGGTSTRSSPTSTAAPCHCERVIRASATPRPWARRPGGAADSSVVRRRPRLRVLVHAPIGDRQKAASGTATGSITP